MNSIFWKGVPSTTIPSLLICELPPISKPRMRIAETVIDGRDGSIIEELGYESYTKTIVIGLRSDFDINEVIKYFTGEGDLVFSNEIDKVYKARIVEGIDFERLIRFKRATVKFLCQPFKYKRDEVFKETEVATASGTSIVVAPKAEEKLAFLKIYGKSTQNGTPTPSAPIDIVSIGDDGSISVSVNDETIGLPIANGLRAVPVDDVSLATYTDASGQMWCADEIDLARGALIKRTKTFTFVGTEGWGLSTRGTNFTQFLVAIPDGKSVAFLCDKLQAITLPEREIKNGVVIYTDTNFRVSLTSPNMNLADFITWLANNPITVIYPLATPIETPLTEEQIAMLNALNMAEPSTIQNDENAFMKVGYFKPFEVFNEGLESSRPLMVLKGSGTVEISVNGTGIFAYTFPEGENEVVIDSEKEDAYLGSVLKNRNMNGEFPILLPKTNKIEWSGNVESIQILPRSRWL